MATKTCMECASFAKTVLSRGRLDEVACTSLSVRLRFTSDRLSSGTLEFVDECSVGW